MSSRALRKLQGEAVLGGEKEDDGASGEESPPSRGGQAFNAFSLLNTMSCSESEVKEDDDVESARGEERRDPLANAGSLMPEKKKKKRKKKTGGKKFAARSSEDNLEDEVEAGVRWVEESIGAPLTLVKEVEEKASPLKALLQIENKHLNPENEMRRIFGTRVVQNEAMARQRKSRGGRTHQRSSMLVSPKPTWPSAARSGLSMRPVASDSPGQWFTLDHSTQYQAVQHQFLAAVDSLNPDQIVALLNTYPMHIDSMLQLSDICKMGEDSAMAAELVERTLYALEAAFHPCFSFASGSCHLDYRRQENRALFIALYRHLHFVGSRACYRTALEICKVLLNLDPAEDPLAIVLLVDFYALRARQFQWLVDLNTAWDPIRNLSQLPNFAYSVALAAFQLSQGKDEEKMSKADLLLQEALLAFPSVLLPLLDKCSIEPHPGLMGEHYFLDSRGESPALATLCSLYVCRTFHCWKEPEILPWLERGVVAVLERLKTGDVRAKASKEERATRYQGLPRNIHRHIILSEHKEALSHLPPELKEANVVAYDPLQPLNSINTYEAPDRQSTALDDPSALRMFFRSILPNFNPADPLQPGLPEGADGAVGGAGQGADLRNSVNSLLDAMRDLLGNLQLPEVPVEGDDEADDAEERDPQEWD